MTHASLFSGIGGPEVAATMLGWDNLFHCEINPFGRKILDYWYPNSKSYEDITKTDFSEWRGKVDVLTGGFPCQPFSYAGKRRGADDDRYLWPYMFKAIDQIRPTWIVAENVAGITTMVEQGEVVEVGGQASMFEEVDGLHRYRLAETFTLQRICNDLEGHGYSVQPVLVPACSVGSPHRRDRVFIIARRSSSDTDNIRHTKERKIRRWQNTEPCGVCEDDWRSPSDTCIDGCGSDERQFREERKNSKNKERDKESEPKRLGIQCGTRAACGGTTTSDTESEQSGRCKFGQPGCCQSQQGEFGGRGVEDVAERHAADTFHAGLQEARPEQPSAGTGRHAVWFGEWVKGQQDVGIAGCGRWQNFPTVSPVHRGNDGIPFDVDDLSIPFSKWRTESLKAYGNAIVPQVMYEIFRAIESVENQ